jgi:PAS domain-containing protein
MDAFIQQTQKKSHTFLVVTFLLIIFFAFISIVGNIAVGRKIDSLQRKTLSTRAETAALAVDPELIKKLNGEPSDISLPEYQTLKKLMVNLKTTNADARFVYLMGLDGEKLFFYVDSESPDSKEYSAPGDIYEETTSEELENYQKGTAFVQGPYEDKWGKWVTAEAPIFDSNRQTIAIIGIDISTAIWRTEILFARIMISVSSALLTVFLLILYMYLERSIKSLDSLKQSKSTLEAQKAVLSEAEEVAGIGRFTLLLGSGTMTWDKTMYTFFSIPEGTKIDREMFESYIDDNDRPKIKQLFDSLTSGSESRAILEYTISNKDTHRTLLSIMKAYKGPQGEITRIVGTTQDVSGRR